MCNICFCFYFSGSVSVMEQPRNPDSARWLAITEYNCVCEFSFFSNIIIVESQEKASAMANKGEEKVVPAVGVNLTANLSDVSVFSYTGLCVVLLKKYFEDKWHRDFKLKTVHQLEEHLDLPAQVRESMYAILDEEGIEDVDPFVTALLEDPFLQKSGLTIVFDLLILGLKDGKFSSRMRFLIKRVAWNLRVKWEEVEHLELSVVENLSTNQYLMSEEEQKEKASHAKKQRIKRIALISLATIGGGTLIGLTGGLAAPLVAAGAGAIIGGAGAAALGSVAGVAVIGSLFGVAGAGISGYKMKKRVGAVEEFEFEPLIHGGPLQSKDTPSRQLHITIAVTGWLNKDMKDVRKPWKCLMNSNEQYCLRYETEHLLAFGTAFDYILSVAMSMAVQESLKYTVLSGILAAVAWPAALVSAANVIDNPWSVCVQRSVGAGKQLAEVLLAREQGHRPVTLIGYSLGARVIFSCLEELSNRKGCEGIVEDVILLGAPVSGSSKHWEPFGRVVAGKIVNGYCRGDWLLKFLYRTSSVQIKIAGLHPVRWEDRRMCNIDLSDLVTGHMDYLIKLEEILNVIGVRTISSSGHPIKSTSSQSLASPTAKPSSPSKENPAAENNNREPGAISQVAKSDSDVSVGNVPQKAKGQDELAGHTAEVTGNALLQSSNKTALGSQPQKSLEEKFTDLGLENRNDSIRTATEERVYVPPRRSQGAQNSALRYDTENTNP
ncbi:LOW QUALITY PROTEIN: transmembrane and coiled-coil domain-containing protein 4-like [Liolophura sinensis]|uniref:LOW QUALITY PROTEIN: transmembrane and coiled-coil domain-containing protein 4-like n=1 Tax=Liolophura sinensis TaxID=3198878 RepID=UPI003158A96D